MTLGAGVSLHAFVLGGAPEVAARLLPQGWPIGAGNDPMPV